MNIDNTCSTVDEVLASPEAKTAERLLKGLPLLGDLDLRKILSNGALAQSYLLLLKELDPAGVIGLEQNGKVEQVLNVIDNSEPQNADIKAVYDFVQLASAKLAEKFQTREGVPHGMFATDFDLVMAATNAACYKECFAIPPVDLAKYRANEHIPVSRSNDLVLFRHLTKSLMIRRDIPRALVLQQLQMLENYGMAMVDRYFYDEYVATLQGITGSVHQHPDKYMDELTSLTAGLNYFTQNQPGKISFPAVGNPMLSVSEFRRGNVEIASVLDRQKYEFKAESVFIPGSGIMSLQAFPALVEAAKKGLKVTLNDNNPFVSGTLSKLAGLYAAKNMNVASGGFENVQLPDGSVDLTVLSLVHVAGEEAISKLVQNAARFLNPRGNVVIVNPDEVSVNREGVVTKDIEEIFRRNGFKQRKKVSRNHEFIADLNYDPEWNIRASAKDLINRSMQMAKAPVSRGSSSLMIYGR